VWWRDEVMNGDQLVNNNKTLPLYQSRGLPRARSLSYSSSFLPARRYARANTGYGSVFVFLSASVYHKSVFYRKGWTDRAGFWHGGFFRPILHRVGCNKFRYLENKGTSC